MARFHKVRIAVSGAAVLGLLTGCAVGPGTPLLDALKTDPGKVSTNVPAPRTFGPPVGADVSYGLINPDERRETEEYLETLAPR